MKGKGMPGGMGGMQQMMKQAQEMQKALVQAQNEVEDLFAEDSSGGGVVKVTVSGKNRILAIDIKPEAVEPPLDIEMLQDLLIVAINGALEKVQQQADQKMKAVTGGIKFPGM
jgi:nucleoid-associated protein EbfC